ncbi:MAG TPA: TolC family protein [Gemmatimonadales bacterium]|nr:TolC family protein [Gemmatimonadales bacterium]
MHRPGARALFTFALVTALGGRAGSPAVAQQVLVTRQVAIDSALARGPRLGIARADTAVASAQLRAAREWPNPGLATTYSKAVPQYHVLVDFPLEYPWVRSNRTSAAQAARTASLYRFAFERAAIALDADTSYTRAVNARARALLSERNARDADSLRRLAVLRRDAGDASDLEVELATINAGQQANAAAADSLALVVALLGLQATMGIGGEQPVITVPDSLEPPPAPVATDPPGVPLQVAAAEQALASAELGLRLARRSVFGAPSIAAGLETGDPTGSEPGILPTVGLTLPLPLFNQNRGAIAQAEAERERSRAEVALVRLAAQTQISRATRERDNALAKVERDRALLGSAIRVADMALTGYREGASTLVNVLEAQRAARDIRAQYLDDLAAAWTAISSLKLFSLVTSTAGAQP